jgi:hypothetical protein
MSRPPSDSQVKVKVMVSLLLGFQSCLQPSIHQDAIFNLRHHPRRGMLCSIVPLHPGPLKCFHDHPSRVYKLISRDSFRSVSKVVTSPYISKSCEYLNGLI